MYLKPERPIAEQPINEDDGNYAIRLRQLLYRCQNNDGLTETFQNIVLVTFDGPKGAGKSSLTQALGNFVAWLDPSQKVRHAVKPSEISDGISSILREYQRKEEEGEQLPISDVQMDGYLLQYIIALARIGASQPDYAFLERSFITTLAKSWQVAVKNDSSIIEDLYQRKMGKCPQLLSEEEFSQWYHHNPQERDTHRWEFLVRKMRNKYVLPDLAVILLCDDKTSSGNQQKRGRRKVRSSAEREISSFYAFRDGDIFPNALYLDQSQSLSENFRKVALAFKERCEDKGRNSFAGLISRDSIDQFLQKCACQ